MNGQVNDSVSSIQFGAVVSTVEEMQLTIKELADGLEKQRVRVGVGGRVLARHLPDCARYCGSSVTCSHGCWLGTCRIVPGTAAV